MLGFAKQRSCVSVVVSFAVRLSLLWWTYAYDDDDDDDNNNNNNNDDDDDDDDDDNDDDDDQERVQQLTGPRFWAIVLDRWTVRQLSAKGPGQVSWMDF